MSFVFDIRDSSVALAAVKFEAGEKPEIIYCQNFHILTQDTGNHQKYLNSMIMTLDKAVLSVRKTLIKIGHTEKIADHSFFIGSPWSVSQSKLVKVVKDKPYEINNSFLKKIITSEETEAEKFMGQDLGVNGWQVLEEKVLQSKLNGYVIEKIFGKKTVDFEAEIFVSYIPSDIREKIYAMAGKEIKGDVLRYSGSPILPSYSFLRDAYPEKKDFIYVNMGDMITDAYVVKDGIVSAIASFPSGGKDIMQSALKSAKTSEHLISSAINIRREGNYDESMQKDLEQAIAPAVEAWLGKLKDTLSKLCADFDIPKEMFIIPRGEIQNFAVKEINGREKNKLNVSGTEINMQIVDEQAINDKIINGKAFSGEPYVKMDIAFLGKTIR